MIFVVIIAVAHYLTTQPITELFLGEFFRPQNLGFTTNHDKLAFSHLFFIVSCPFFSSDKATMLA
jgi:hypothetical protein